jgi:hypothetical protein
MAIRNIEVFLEVITIASAWIKFPCKRFLKQDTFALIPSGGYMGNINYSKKANMRLIHRERTDKCTILNGRYGREFRLPKLPNLNVDGYCARRRKVYEFLGCFFLARP